MYGAKSLYIHCATGWKAKEIKEGKVIHDYMYVFFFSKDMDITESMWCGCTWIATEETYEYRFYTMMFCERSDTKNSGTTCKSC